MDVKYYINDKPVSWKRLTLKEMTQTYVPTGWEELFEATEDLIPEISKKLESFAKTNVIYPPMPLVFNAFDAIQPKDVKVVIIGQDPYIRKGEAMGWSFSVPDGIPVPPSLRNIYKELDAEGYTGYKNRKTGNLLPWVDKGVFLLNSCLTVNKGESASHKDLWEEFTETTINFLNQFDHIAWILLGQKSRKYASLLDPQRQGIFTAGHPSPLNRNSDFSGSDIFKEAEWYLLTYKRIKDEKFW